MHCALGPLQQQQQSFFVLNKLGVGKIYSAGPMFYLILRPYKLKLYTPDLSIPLHRHSITLDSSARKYGLCTTDARQATGKRVKQSTSQIPSARRAHN